MSQKGSIFTATYRLSESYAELNQRSLGSFNPIRLSATTNFKTTEVDGYIPYYVDRTRGALAIDARKEAYRNRPAAAQHRFAGDAGSMPSLCTR